MLCSAHSDDVKAPHEDHTSDHDENVSNMSNMTWKWREKSQNF